MEESENPYEFHHDQDLETYARGVIDDAMAKVATSPRDFAFYSASAAKQITQYVLQRYERKAGA